VSLSAAVGSLPEVAFEPLHAPEAVHDVAFVEDHVRVEVPLTFTEVGKALSVTVGAAGGGGLPFTVTVADCPAAPPAPVHVRLNVELALMMGDCSEPAIAFAPAHAPEALQPVAFCEFHVSAERSPAATDVGLALKDRIGDGRMPIVAERCVAPPEPVHDSM